MKKSKSSSSNTSRKMSRSSSDLANIQNSFPVYIPEYGKDKTQIACRRRQVKLFTKEESAKITKFIYDSAYPPDETQNLLSKSGTRRAADNREIASRVAAFADRDRDASMDNLSITIERNTGALRFERSGIHMWGAVSAAPIPAGEPIVEYVGELIRLRVVDKRQEIYESEGNNGSYIFRLDDDLYIDATRNGGIARYINHSCSPNCDTRIVKAGGHDHVVICALRDIQPWEELCYDYRLPYEPKEKRIQCLCGSEKCRGWLNWCERYEESLVKEQEYVPENEEEEEDVHDDVNDATFE